MFFKMSWTKLYRNCVHWFIPSKTSAEINCDSVEERRKVSINKQTKFIGINFCSKIWQQDDEDNDFEWVQIFQRMPKLSHNSLISYTAKRSLYCWGKFVCVAKFFNKWTNNALSNEPIPISGIDKWKEKWMRNLYVHIYPIHADAIPPLYCYVHSYVQIKHTLMFTELSITSCIIY